MNVEQAQNVMKLVGVINESELIQFKYISEDDSAKCCVIGYGMKLAGIDLPVEIKDPNFSNGNHIDEIPQKYCSMLKETFGLELREWKELQKINDMGYMSYSKPASTRKNLLISYLLDKLTVEGLGLKDGRRE